MPIDAKDAVTKPHGSTGPKTEAGKAKSSRNAIRTGLYAARDFIREGEEEEYTQTLIQLMDELTPEGIVEQTFATEIMGAHWRLRRCRLIEAAFSTVEDLDFDPMMDERTEKQQKSVDRARAQSHLILRRSLAELRNLQKGRTIQQQLQDQKPTPKPNTGLPNMDALMAMADHQLARQYREQGLSSFCNPVAPPASAPEPAPKTATSICNPPSTTPAVSRNIPRNAPCPCRSGAKYKKCCGGPAATALNQAA
jgi:hypothetical protein